MATLRIDTNNVPYVGKDRADGEVEVFVRHRPEFVAVRAYDGTPVAINAGQTITYDITSAVSGCADVSVTLIEMTQNYEVSIETRPVSAAAWYTEAKVAGTAMSSGSVASVRHGFSFAGPIGPLVRLVIKNTSGSNATLKGVYVSGR